MIDSISPYALLKASRPKQPAAYITDYDLYSAAQQPSAALPASPPPAAGDPPSAAHSAPAQHARQSSAAPARSTPGKTHYIADIHSRHSRALSRAKLGRAALSDQSVPLSSPASVQTPPQ